MRTTGRRGEPDRSKTGASRHLPVRRESDNPRKGKPDRSEVGGGRPLNRVQKERQLKQDIGEIEATELADGSVTEAKLASGAVTSTKIGVDAITEDSISSASVSESKINDGAVTTNKLDSNNSLVVLSGVPLGDSDLGKFDDYTYPGPPSVVYETVIPDDTDIQTALQSLSTEAGRLMAEIVFNVGEINTLKSNTATLFHGRYDTEAEARRDDNDAATTKTEVYYTARPDGDGYAESEVTASTPAGAVIERRLFYSDKFNADVNTPADWTAYTTQPADDTAFATAKASLLAGLNDTDGTANTRGTLPLSLKMEHTFVTDKLLNDYPALAGFSVRLIRFGYSGNCIKVRRSSDNSELDIGFDSNGDLDISAIETHCGSSDGFVSVWYDQSGNGNDVTQVVTSLQPKIYDGSAVVQDNGRPAIQAISSSNYLRWPGTIITGTGARSMLCVANADSAVNDNFLALSSSATGNGAQWNWTPEVRIRVIGDRRYDNNPMDTQTIGMLTFPAGGDTTDIDFYENGTQATVSTVTTAYAINTGTSGFAYMHSTLGKMQEMVLWTSDQDSNVTGINNDADTYYKPTTQLLIDTYSGAAAAYSVRKLSQWYTGNCMKVQRGDGQTQDIGFDSNGDLDTAAIKTFCDADTGGTPTNGTVHTWYDQSGNGRNASQSTASSQPEIYDGSAVFTENGKPIIRESADFFGNYHLNITFSSGLSANAWIGCVITNYGPVNHKNTLLHGDSSGASELFMWSQAGNTLSGFVGLGSGGVTLYKDGSSWSATTRGDVYTDTYNVGQLLIMADADLSTYAGVGANVSLGHRDYTDLGLFSMQEFIIWDADQSSNRTGIESNINTYFSIY